LTKSATPDRAVSVRRSDPALILRHDRRDADPGRQNLKPNFDIKCRAA
jgi:hypothetical protein